ncbi:hypothetical protein CO610_04850 [Lysobacteraceae bacterium NML95-0200]|nr:hypothetical protein CO610_04850 [Xanthomonadaceae bacterium NML95-0200]
MLVCNFTPFDTWFFRESRPHGSIGSNELGSVFPPPVRTLAGALRTLIGDTWHQRNGSDWRSFNEQSPLAQIIGFGDDLGSLRLQGPFIALDEKRLYPAPANLMCKQQGDTKHYFLLELGAPMQCDLGRVRLPQFPSKVDGLEELAGSAPVENAWLTHAGMQAVLNGNAPEPGDVIESNQLFQQEPRLGIGRDNSSHFVKDGLLYQTRHLRLQPGVSVQLYLHGLQDASLLPERSVIRLGGEGRQAALQVSRQNQMELPQAKVTSKSCAVLYALTPMPCADGLPAGIPQGFQAVKHNEADVWEGRLNGQSLRILAVACPRVLREGGWDLASHKARPVQSLLAPGSVLYVESTDNSPLKIDKLTTADADADATGRSQFLAGVLKPSCQYP